MMLEGAFEGRYGRFWPPWIDQHGIHLGNSIKG